MRFLSAFSFAVWSARVADALPGQNWIFWIVVYCMWWTILCHVTSYCLLINVFVPWRLCSCNSTQCYACWQAWRSACLIIYCIKCGGCHSDRCIIVSIMIKILMPTDLSLVSVFFLSCAGVSICGIACMWAWCACMRISCNHKTYLVTMSFGNKKNWVANDCVGYFF